MTNRDQSTNFRRRYVAPYLRRFIRGFWIAGAAWIAVTIAVVFPAGSCFAYAIDQDGTTPVGMRAVAMAVGMLYLTLASPVMFDIVYRKAKRHLYRTWVRQARRNLKRYGHTTSTSSKKP